MDTTNLQLPNSLHDQARKLAAKENISLDQLIILALAEKVSALLTEEYLGQRAKRGTKKKFKRALAKVADVEPDQEDKL